MSPNGNMIAATRVGAKEQGAERRLQDLLRRIAGNRAGVFAVYVHLARATAQSSPQTRRRLIQTFESLAERREASVFLLANRDLVLICRDVPVPEIDLALNKMSECAGELGPRHGIDRPGGRDEGPAKWYDLSAGDEFQRFCEFIRNLGTKELPRSAGIFSQPLGRGDQPLDAEKLATIGRKLHEIHISDLIRQQTALEIHRSGTASPLFRETYFAINDLLARLAPDVDVLSDACLFRHFTQSLDRRLMASLARRSKFVDGEVPLSINLNVSTIATREFQKFKVAHDRDAGRMVVEIQLVDVLTDIDAYRKARDVLHAQGYNVLIDGLGPLTPRYLNIRALEADFIKIWWSSDVVGRCRNEQTDAVRNILDAAGRAKVILARTDSEQAVKWALSLGIHRFQGYFIDRLAVAMGMRPAT